MSVTLACHRGAAQICLSWAIVGSSTGHTVRSYGSNERRFANAAQSTLSHRLQSKWRSPGSATWHLRGQQWRNASRRARVDLPSRQHAWRSVRAGGVRIAHLAARHQDTREIPEFADETGTPQSLTTFLKLPAGRQSMLNVRALTKVEQLEQDLYRCHLSGMEILNLTVSPVFDLRVTCGDAFCLVEMLSCKFEGSDAIQQQNKRFSASLSNRLTWGETSGGVRPVHVDVQLQLRLEVFTVPFTLLPLSAVEAPGCKLLQALLERLTPLFLQQLAEDYRRWAVGEVEIPGFLEAHAEAEAATATGAGAEVAAGAGAGAGTEAEAEETDKLGSAGPRPARSAVEESVLYGEDGEEEEESREDFKRAQEKANVNGSSKRSDGSENDNGKKGSAASCNQSVVAAGVGRAGKGE